MLFHVTNDLQKSKSFDYADVNVGDVDDEDDVHNDRWEGAGAHPAVMQPSILFQRTTYIPSLYAATITLFTQPHNKILNTNLYPGEAYT